MEALQSYWQARSQREQRGILITSIVLILAIIYFGLLSPLSTRIADSEKALNNEQELASWVSGKVSAIKSLKKSGNQAASVSNLPLNQAITTSVNSFKLEIVRLQPQDNELQVWLQPMSFNTLLQWLDELEKRYGIQVKFIEVAKGATQGMVEVKRLQLGRS